MWRWKTVGLAILGTIIGLPSAALTLLGVWPQLQARHDLLPFAASFIHYGTLGWILTLLITIMLWRLTHHRWLPWLALGCAAALAVHALWLWPYLRAKNEPQQAALTVTVINIEVGHDDPRSLARRLGGSDVVILIEATPETVATLARTDMVKRYPHRVGDGAPGPAGAVIYSRLPMTDMGVGPTQLESRLVKVTTAAGPVLVAGVHPRNPQGGAGEWSVDAALLHSWLRPHMAQDMVIAGDFNAIDRHVTMRPYADAGYRNAATIAGGGLPRTWPNDRVYPPVIGIDHILLSPRLSVSALETLDVPGTDHRGLRATVGLRR